jgi:hypothetical protein
MDLGADGWQTFRYIILPNLGSALLAGGMLAFALSFDEIIVTTFTAGHERTLPLWLLNQLSRPRDVPVTNVVAMLVMMVTMLPILGAYYLTRGGECAGSGSAMKRQHKDPGGAGSLPQQTASKRTDANQTLDQRPARQRRRPGPTVLNPALGLLVEINEASEAQVDAAVRAADAAFDSWSQTTERALAAAAQTGRRHRSPRRRTGQAGIGQLRQAYSAALNDEIRRLPTCSASSPAPAAA